MLCTVMLMKVVLCLKSEKWILSLGIQIVIKDTGT